MGKLLGGDKLPEFTEEEIDNLTSSALRLLKELNL